ncbi:hypothetical protein Bca52824_016235 [Brassica carinata]|uniref:Uncharacterized protein n=1 Tax=Brassica carinata TaxID=52824 RepID=A0A8X8B6F4_BRACI|nr:hypothetical protein Bca52824_016235 [Brassica carinata]
MSNNVTSMETEKVKVLILKIDENGKDPVQGFPHQDPKNPIAELEDLLSRSEQDDVSEYHMLCKIFPYSISRDAFR